MSEEITLQLSKREIIGKGLGKLKKEGQIPAVIQRPGKESIAVSGSFMELVKVYKNAGKHHPVNITYDDHKILTIIKDVDIEPKKHQLRHIVFSEIKQNVKVEAEVPIVISGEIPAERINLMVLKQLDHVEIEALPKDLPDQLEVSGEKLAEVGDRVTVADIIVPEGVTILTEPEHQIATVEESAAQESEEEATETAETTETPQSSETEKSEE